MKLIHLVLGITAIGAAGCTLPRAGALLPEQRPLGAGQPAFQAPAESADPKAPLPAAPGPEGDIVLRDVLAQALMHSPKLASAAWEVRVAEARVLQAGVPPNPELEVEAEEFGGSGDAEGFDAAETGLRLSQVIELGGKRSARRTLAEIEGRLAGWAHEAERLTVLTDATIGFVDVLAAQERVSLSRELVGVSAETLRAVEARVQAGKVAPLEKARASVELAAGKIALAAAESELRSARRGLAAVWGSTSPRFAAARGELDNVAEIPSWDGVQALLERNPRIERWAAEMEHRLALLALERANRIPDLSVGLGVSRSEESGDHWLSFGLGISLPLFDRNRGGTMEARYRIEKLKQERRDGRVQMVLALAESYEALALAYGEATGLASDVVPSAQRAFDAAREGYDGGKFGYLDVLDAQRVLFEARTDLVDARARYHRAVAVVESFIGTRLEDAQ